MSGITATWTKIAAASQLQRSSHTLSTVGHSIYIFGGELRPREPRDNDVHIVTISTSNTEEPLIRSTAATTTSPSPRVGSATATHNDTVYMFSGRGGPDIAPIDEDGSLWALNTATQKWTLLSPTTAIHPAARSYHALASNKNGILYLHAGCPATGRLADLWAFDISTREWKELASAPDPPRGGTSLAFAEGKLYRMNGFDGKTEQGGRLDVYDPACGSWSSVDFSPDGTAGPGARSVAALVPVKRGGETLLVTLFGESDPSSLGHQGAGKMLGDVWAYSIRKRKWEQVSIASRDKPRARGWFDADVIQVDARERVVVSGGLGESNERLDDVWMFEFLE